MRVLITGAGGMIGRAVVSELSRNCEVIACYHQQPDGALNREHLSSTVCDLLNPEQREELIRYWRPDCLVHLAWCGIGSGVGNNTANIAWLESSLSLIKIFAEYGGKRFIGCGSAHEYGISGAGGTFSEESTVPHPLSLYGKTKLALNAGSVALSQAFGISALWPRIGYVIGRGCSATLLLGEALQAASLKKDFTCRIAPETAFDILDVRDLARLYAQAAGDDSFTGTANFATGRSVNVRTLLEHIFELGNCSGKLHYAMPLNSPQQVVLDNSRLVEHLHVDSFRDPLTLKACDLWEV